MPLKFSVLPFGEIMTASVCSGETCASLCRHTVRNTAFERDLFNFEHCPVAGSSVQVRKPLLPCSALWGSPGTACFTDAAAARTCISQLHHDGPQPGEVSFSCILLSHIFDEEMLPHLKGAVGGEVHPDVGREEPRAAEEEIGSVCMHCSRGSCRGT